VLLVAADDHRGLNNGKHLQQIVSGQKMGSERCYTGQDLYTREDVMDTELNPAILAVEFLRRDKSNLSPAQYLKKLKQLELEFADLLALSSNELKEEIYFAWRLGVHVH
jgi:hypothetical protein